MLRTLSLRIFCPHKRIKLGLFQPKIQHACPVIKLKTELTENSRKKFSAWKEKEYSKSGVNKSPKYLVYIGIAQTAS